MDNNNRRIPLANNQNFPNTILNVLRHFVVPPRQFATNAPQSDDLDDLPPLEPITTQTNPPQATPSGIDRINAQMSSPPTLDDLVMPPRINPTFTSFEQPPRDEDESSMPSLHDLSDTSDLSDRSNNSAEEVERMPDLQPMDDDNDSSWTSDDDGDDDDVDNDLPPLEPVAGSRRARVEDDEDDDRDRRHPSQRTAGNHAQSAPNQRQENRPPFFAGINTPRTDVPPSMIDLFQTFMGGTGPPAGAPQHQNANTRANQNPTPGRHHHHNPPPAGVPPIHFTVDIGDGVPRRWDGQQTENGGFQPPPGFADALFPDMTDEERADPLAQFQMLIERLGGAMGQAFGFAFEDEKEDPERAKRLVAGLEVVPVGLVRRMEKVGGAPGGHVDDSTGEVDVPGCAICWDKLLDAESDGFKAEEGKAPVDMATAEQASAADTSSTDVTMDEQPSTQSQQVSESLSAPPIPEITSDPPAPVIDDLAAKHIDEDSNKIVCLPCAHVFHASCLIPWFSRPRQTTCPTCRFNIDPEHLTYIPRPRQSRPNPPGPAQPIPPAFMATAAPGAPPAAAPANDAPPTGTGVPPNNHPNVVPGAPQGGRGVQAGFAAMFGNGNNNPFQWVPMPVGQPGGGLGQDFAAMFAGIFPGGQAGVPQGSQPQGPPPPPPPFFTPMHGGMPQPMPNPGMGPNQNAANAMLTVDLTLFTSGPFEGIHRNVVVGEGGRGEPAPGAGTPPPPPPQQQPPLPFPFGGAFPYSGGQGPRTSSREKKQWTPPPAPGPTLRSRVEQREREVGLRCCDTSCGIGPSDEDPFPEVSGSAMKQLSIWPLPDSSVMSTRVCPHTFHPTCLVSAERVAGWGGEDKKEGYVEVSCPNCRAVGCVSREEWEEGVSGLA